MRPAHVYVSGVRVPRMNAVMERWIQSCRRELLDRTLIWNQPHLLNALRQYERHYNAHRPHRGINNATPAPATRPDHRSQHDHAPQDDSFGRAEEVTEQKALVRGLPVGFESQLPGSIPTSARQTPEPYVDTTRPPLLSSAGLERQPAPARWGPLAHIAAGQSPRLGPVPVSTSGAVTTLPTCTQSAPTCKAKPSSSSLPL